MFTHIMIGSNNLERSRAFYDATFTALGGKPGERDERGRLIYDHDGGRLMITRPSLCLFSVTVRTPGASPEPVHWGFRLPSSITVPLPVTEPRLRLNCPIP